MHGDEAKSWNSIKRTSNKKPHTNNQSEEPIYNLSPNELIAQSIRVIAMYLSLVQRLFWRPSQTHQRICSAAPVLWRRWNSDDTRWPWPLRPKSYHNLSRENPKRKQSVVSEKSLKSHLARVESNESIRHTRRPIEQNTARSRFQTDRFELVSMLHWMWIDRTEITPWLQCQISFTWREQG